MLECRSADLPSLGNVRVISFPFLDESQICAGPELCCCSPCLGGGAGSQVGDSSLAGSQNTFDLVS